MLLPIVSCIFFLLNFVDFIFYIKIYFGKTKDLGLSLKSDFFVCLFVFLLDFIYL